MLKIRLHEAYVPCSRTPNEYLLRFALLRNLSMTNRFGQERTP